MTVYIKKREREDLANNPAVHPKQRRLIKQMNQDVTFETASTTTTGA
jgi:hypothetical protein